MMKKDKFSYVLCIFKIPVMCPRTSVEVMADDDEYTRLHNNNILYSLWNCIGVGKLPFFAHALWHPAEHYSKRQRFYVVFVVVVAVDAACVPANGEHMRSPSALRPRGLQKWPLLKYAYRGSSFCSKSN